MLHLLTEPAGTGAEGVMSAVPLPAPAMADTHAATESAVNAPTKMSHLGVKRRGRITNLVETAGKNLRYPNGAHGGHPLTQIYCHQGARSVPNGGVKRA